MQTTFRLELISIMALLIAGNLIALYLPRSRAQWNIILVLTGPSLPHLLFAPAPRPGLGSLHHLLGSGVSTTCPGLATGGGWQFLIWLSLRWRAPRKVIKT